MFNCNIFCLYAFKMSKKRLPYVLKCLNRSNWIWYITSITHCPYAEAWTSFQFNKISVPKTIKAAWALDKRFRCCLLTKMHGSYNVQQLSFGHDFSHMILFTFCINSIAGQFSNISVFFSYLVAFSVSVIYMCGSQWQLVNRGPLPPPFSFYQTHGQICALTYAQLLPHCGGLLAFTKASQVRVARSRQTWPLLVTQR